MAKVVVLHLSEMYLITLTILTTHLTPRLAGHHSRLLASSSRTPTRLLLLSKLFLKLSLVDGGPEAWGVGHSGWLIRNFVSDLDILPSLLCEDLRELIDVSSGICQCAQFKPEHVSCIICCCQPSLCFTNLQVLPLFSPSL